MNEKETLVEMTGNIVKEAWENGRREALKEIADQNLHIETLRDENRKMREEIDRMEGFLRRIRDFANEGIL